MNRKPIAAAAVALAWAAAPAAADKLSPEFRSAFERSFRTGRTYAVVMQKGVPTTSIYGVEGNQTATHYSIDVIDGEWKTSGGFLDTDQTAADFLDLGEVMELAAISYKENRVDLRMVSVESKKVRRGGGLFSTEKREPVATNFKFFLPGDKSRSLTAADVPEVLEYIGAYLKPCANEAEARTFSARLITGQETAAAPAGGRARPAETPRAASAGAKTSAAPATSKKEIKPGMTPDEVRAVLGKPEHELTFQTRTRWTYPSLTVVFENGKVTEVKF
jgi:hypothetical protein